MEDPTAMARSPGRLLRAYQRNRLEKQLMSDAYECLVPILKCRCDRSVGMDCRPAAAGLGDEQVAKARCAGGGL